MSTELKLRRGNTAQHNSFIGGSGEVTYNTETKELHTHDGVTVGGEALVSRQNLAAPDSAVLVGGVPASRLSKTVIQVTHLKALPTTGLVNNQQFSVAGFYADTNVGGGTFVYDANRSWADHNGGTVIALGALNAWDGTQGGLAGYLDWVGSGSGCFVKHIKEKNITVSDFGAVKSNLVDSTPAVKKQLEVYGIADFGDKGHFLLTDELNLVRKKIRGGRRSPTVENGDDGVLLEFVLPTTDTPCVNIGNFYEISGVAIKRAGINKRGIIIKVSAFVQRTSYIKDVLLAGCSSAISGASNFNLYSNIFENIEINDWTGWAINIQSLGSTGNILKNIYMSNWLDFSNSVKNTCQGFISFSGSQDEGSWSQINCEHAIVQNACILTSGVSSPAVSSTHFEGVEFAAFSSFFRISASGRDVAFTIVGGCARFNKCLGVDVSFLKINAGGDTNPRRVTVNITGFTAQSNDANGQVGQRLATRDGAGRLARISIVADGYHSDLWQGNSFIPLAKGQFIPAVEKINSTIFYEFKSGLHFLPSRSSFPTSGFLPKNAYFANSEFNGINEQGWRTYTSGFIEEAERPILGSGTFTQFQSTVIVDSQVYQEVVSGDGIEANGSTFFVTGKFGGNTLTISVNSEFSGSFNIRKSAPLFIVL